MRPDWPLKEACLGAAWIRVVHMDEGPARISPEDYRIGVRWQLGIPLLPLTLEAAICPVCNSPADVFGDHLLCCRRNNFYGRHFAVQEALVGMAQAADLSFVREAALPKSNQGPHGLRGPALRPADLLLRAWSGGTDLAVDVTVKHPLQENQKPWTRQKADGFLKAKEAEKVTKYHQACALEGWAFSPAAFDSWGGVGPKAKDLLYRLLRRAVGGVPIELRSLRMEEFRQQLSLALMRQVWKLLAAKNRY